MTTSLLWFRRDLRLDDNPALLAALRTGAVVPLYIHAPAEEAPWAPGAASEAWLRMSLAKLDADLRAHGSALVLRRGPSMAALEQLLGETGATEVHWNRRHEPACIRRDRDVAAALRARGVEARTHNAALWLDPARIATQTGGHYRVFTPFWRNLRACLDELPVADPRPATLGAMPALASVPLDELIPPPSPRWDIDALSGWQPGEAGAASMLDDFVDAALDDYQAGRDAPDRIGTTRLSPHLHFGEISPRRILARLRSQRWPAAVGPQVEALLRQLGWREFSIHLLHHFPHTAEANLSPKFDHFEWAEPDAVAIDAWRRGRTGVPLVDAGMRELWATGWMHNRVRMVVASFLTKNLRQHWLTGARWFWDTLFDADLANNTQGWQWTAGTGADAAPYFRIFNPVSQAQRFDPAARYVRRWLPGFAALPDEAVFEPWRFPDRLDRHAPDYPRRPILDLKASRSDALASYARLAATSAR